MKNKTRSYLPKLFGDSVKIKILESLLEYYLEEQSLKGDKLNWQNISNIGKKAGVSRSSSKRILGQLLIQNFVEENIIETHAQKPPRYFRLNNNNQAIRELIFFYKKIRGFL